MDRCENSSIMICMMVGSVIFCVCLFAEEIDRGNIPWTIPAEQPVGGTARTNASQACVTMVVMDIWCFFVFFKRFLETKTTRFKRWPSRENNWQLRLPLACNHDKECG